MTSKRDLNDVEKQADEQQALTQQPSHRESEGQDTITPLTNSIFLKQLSKLKHTTQALMGSSKSLGDSGGSSESLKSLGSLGGSKQSNVATKTPDTLMALFEAPPSINPITTSDLIRSASVSAKHLNSINSIHSSTAAERLVEALTSMVSFNRELAMTPKPQLRKLNNNNENQSEFVFDQDFIADIRLIVMTHELRKRHRLSKSIFTCRLVVGVFGLLMIAMIIYFFMTMNSIVEEFMEQEKLRMGNLTLNHMFTSRRSLNKTTMF